MVRSFHLIGRSFSSFSVKLYMKWAFLASWLKELGVHMSNILVSACGLRTCEKFWLYCGMRWLLIEKSGLEWFDLDYSMKREEKCDIMLPWLQNFWISTTFKILWRWWMCPLKSNRVPKCDVIENEICEIMGFVKIFWKNNVQDAYSPKISNLGQIVSEILAQLCSDDSIQILLNLTWFLILWTKPNLEGFVWNRHSITGLISQRQFAPELLIFGE